VGAGVYHREAWFTLRERPDMNRYRPSFVEPDRPDHSATIVRTPSGTVSRDKAARDGQAFSEDDEILWEWITVARRLQRDGEAL
jgi:hypothetical protein